MTELIEAPVSFAQTLMPALLANYKQDHREVAENLHDADQNPGISR